MPSYHQSTHSTGSIGGVERFTMRSRYIEAMREGPARVPDHILVNHPTFNRDRPSPYMLYYYDITAPNPTLLENDVVRDARLRRPKDSVTIKYWKEYPQMEYVSNATTEESSSCKKHYSSSKRNSGSAAQSRVDSRRGSRYSRSAPRSSTPIESPTSNTPSSTSTKYTYGSSYAPTEYGSSYTSGYQNSHGSSVAPRNCHSRSEASHKNRDVEFDRVNIDDAMHPDLRPVAYRDLHFAKRELYFDAHVMPEDSAGFGTKYSHLPQYSTSYKNYPYVAFDVLHPRNYREFFNERNTPGFFTAHRPTNFRLQGRTGIERSGYNNQQA